MAGRKTLLTPTVITEAAKFLNSGCFEKHVYTSMGINEATWFLWKQRGQEIEAMIENKVYKEEDLDGNERLYLQFMEVCRAARAKTINLNLLLILKHAKTNWMAAKWYLEVVEPGLFKPKEHFLLEHLGELGSISHLNEEDRAELKEELDRIFDRPDKADEE